MRSIFKVISVLGLFLCAIVFSLTVVGIYTIPDNIILTDTDNYGVRDYYFAEILADDGKVKSVSA